MLKTIVNLLGLLLLFSACGTTYQISESSLTFLSGGENRRYIDVDKMASLPPGKITFVVATDRPLYLGADQELRLKTGWSLRGRTGNETILKEHSRTTSACKIQQADQVELANLRIRAVGEYVPAPGQALVLIDNQAGLKGGIRLRKLKLSGHYSGITIHRGDNIQIEDCVLIENSHQVYLGRLTNIPRSEIKNYRVDDVQILRTRISESRRDTSFGNDGIKTLANCTNIKVDRCRIERNWGDAIDLFPGGVDVEISGNELSHNRANGVEVKMSNEYAPDETGQIRRVIISENQLVGNDFAGLRVIDNPGAHYARGIRLENNRIDSSGQYGVHANLPLLVLGNTLSSNGLRVQLKRPTSGYAGIYLLNVERPGAIVVSNNEVVDQAPIATAETTYWINLNNVDHPFTFSGNVMKISPAYRDSFAVNAYGVYLQDVEYAPPLDTLRKYNRCGLGFSGCLPR